MPSAGLRASKRAPPRRLPRGGRPGSTESSSRSISSCTSTMRLLHALGCYTVVPIAPVRRITFRSRLPGLPSPPSIDFHIPLRVVFGPQGNAFDVLRFSGADPIDGDAKHVDDLVV